MNHAAAARRPAALQLALVLLAAVALLLAGCNQVGGGGQVRATGSSSGVGSGLQPGSTDPTSGLKVVALSSLPAEASDTVRLIKSNGPFPYHQDGVVYHNNNRVLPAQPNGYYHEYTVKTPGAHNRGARRIIHGSGDEYYWTADHYDSFQRIA